MNQKLAERRCEQSAKDDCCDRIENLAPGLVGRKIFDLDRIDAGMFVLLRHRWIEPAVEFRYIDYEERVLSANDYRATIVALKLTRRFGPGDP